MELVTRQAVGDAQGDGVALAPAQQRRRHGAVDGRGRARSPGDVHRQLADGEIELSSREDARVAGPARGRCGEGRQAKAGEGAAGGDARDEAPTGKRHGQAAHGRIEKHETAPTGLGGGPRRTAGRRCVFGVVRRHLDGDIGALGAASLRRSAVGSDGAVRERRNASSPERHGQRARCAGLPSPETEATRPHHECRRSHNRPSCSSPACGTWSPMAHARPSHVAWKRACRRPRGKAAPLRAYRDRPGRPRRRPWPVSSR